MKNKHIGQEEQLKFERLFRYNPLPMTLSSIPENTFTDANYAFLELFGYAVSEIIGKTAVEINLIIAPEKHANWGKYKKNERRVGVELQTRHKNGSVIEGLFFGEVISNQGKKFFLTSIIDITERKNAEASLKCSESNYRLLAENANDIIYTLSLSGLFTYVSPSWKTFLGHEIAEIQSKSIEEFIHADDIVKYQNYLKKTLENGNGLHQIEYRIMHKNGYWCWHTSSISHHRDDEGVITAYIGIARDTSEHKRERDLIDDVMRILQHDLRSPLSSIIGFSSLMLDAKNDEFSNAEVMEFVALINSSANNMNKMINSYLQLSKLEKGSVKINKNPKTLKDLIVDLKYEFSILRETNGQNLQIIPRHPQSKVIDYDIFKIEIMMDDTLIKSVFSNLFRNAAEASHFIKDDIVLNIYRDDNFVYFSVVNSGEIPEEFRNKLFQKYATTKKTGTGLGLYSTKLITKVHGGGIEYSADDGKSIFTVSLPLR